MTTFTSEEILEINVYLDGEGYAGITLRELLLSLVSLVWEDGESFSGKRPFGNSDWQERVYVALADAGAYVDYYSDDFDYREANAIIQAAIKTL